MEQEILVEVLRWFRSIANIGYRSDILLFRIDMKELS